MNVVRLPKREILLTPNSFIFLGLFTRNEEILNFQSVLTLKPYGSTMRLLLLRAQLTSQLGCCVTLRLLLRKLQLLLMP
jgi:hypothetical protein